VQWVYAGAQHWMLACGQEEKDPDLYTVVVPHLRRHQGQKRKWLRVWYGQ
jgi:hypothetical protein